MERNNKQTGLNLKGCFDRQGHLSGGFVVILKDKCCRYLIWLPRALAEKQRSERVASC